MLSEINGYINGRKAARRSEPEDKDKESGDEPPAETGENGGAGD
jgi:hypothetical protein